MYEAGLNVGLLEADDIARAVGKSVMCIEEKVWRPASCGEDIRGPGSFFGFFDKREDRESDLELESLWLRFLCIASVRWPV